MKTIQEFDEQIKWLTDYIQRWDSNEETHIIEQGILIDEYSSWCEKNGFDYPIADELLEELKDQRGCTEEWTLKGYDE